MADRPKGYQRYPKKILGDDKCLAMDWDVYGMHNLLLDISWQQTPPGTIPNDQAQIRRWLRNPSDDVWRRVWPQLIPAWPVQEDGRRGNAGMIETARKSAVYRSNVGERYKSPTKEPTKDLPNVVIDSGSSVVKSSRFLPPTREEVLLYCQERQNQVNPDQFIDFYTSKGWKIGKNPMKDWKAAVRTWERNSNGNKSSTLDRIAREVDNAATGLR